VSALLFLGPEESLYSDSCRRGRERVFNSKCKPLPISKHEMLTKIKKEVVNGNVLIASNTTQEWNIRIGREFYEVIHPFPVSYSKLSMRKRWAFKRWRRFKGKKILLFMIPCYLGRANDVYRGSSWMWLKLLMWKLVEMKRCKTKASVVVLVEPKLFKEAEPGNKEINIEAYWRSLSNRGKYELAVRCPFCSHHDDDGVKE